MTDVLDITAAANEAVMRLIFDPESRAHPYREYDILRSGDPVQSSDLGFWFITSYEECAALLRHPALSRQHGNSWEMRAQMNNCVDRRWYDHQSRWMLWMDPPEHPRLRKLVSKAFTPRYIERLKPLVEETIESLIDSML